MALQPTSGSSYPSSSASCSLPNIYEERALVDTFEYLPPLEQEIQDVAHRNLGDSRKFSRETIKNQFKNLTIAYLERFNKSHKTGLLSNGGSSFDPDALDRIIDKAQQIPNQETHGVMFRDFSKELVKTGDSDGAIRIAKSIPNLLGCDHLETARNMSLKGLENISEALMMLGDFSKELVTIGDLDGAIRIAKSIPSLFGCDHLVTTRKRKIEVLENISEALVMRGDVDKATEVADSIFIEYRKLPYSEDALDMKDLVLTHISKVLAGLGNFDRAIEITKSISSEPIRNFALRDISRELSRSRKLHKATEIAGPH